MTGISPHVSGVYDNRQSMREILPGAELMPKFFSRQGYWSAGSGKILHYFIDAQSWDEYYPSKETEDPFPRTLYPKQRPVNLPRGGPWQYIETDWAALDATDEEFGGDYLVSDWVGKQLSRQHDKPFFLACGIYRPHEPWFVPQKYFDAFPIDEIKLPPGYLEGDLDDLPTAGKRRGANRYFAHIRNHGQWRQAIQGYLASISFADAMIGRVLDALESGPNRDNTIVVLWSDHGWHLGEKQHWQKYTGWRVCTRVPLIVRVPKQTPGLPAGTQSGTRCDQPVNLLSLFPTLAELAGLPARKVHDGPSLLPLLQNANADWPHPSVTHLNRPGNYSISGKDWRYIRYDDGGEELYNVLRDRYEWNNLAGASEHAARLQHFRDVAPTSFKPFVAPSDKALATLEFRTINKGNVPPSRPDGNKFEIVLINERQQGVKVYWMDRSGKPRPYGTLEAGWRKRQSTRPGAVWMIADQTDNPLGYFVVGDRTAKGVVPKPAK